MKSMRLGFEDSKRSCPRCAHLLGVLRDLHSNDSEAIAFALEEDLDKYLNEWLEYYLELDDSDSEESDHS